MNFIYKKYLNKLHVGSVQQTDAIHILNPFELQSIKKEYQKTMFQAALLAFLGALLYFLPTNYFSIFSKQVAISFFGKTFSFTAYDTALVLVLTIAEIYLLTFIHLRMTHNIAVFSGFITPENKLQNIDKLNQIATAKKDKDIIKYGLDPYQEVNKFGLFFLNIFIKLQGLLANNFLKYLVRRFASRFAVKSVLDFIGTPIYMGLNLFATYQIYRNAKAEIFGSQLINNFISQLKPEALSADDKKIIYDTLQLIAISKRDFHPNHSVLAQKIMQFYQIPIEKKHLLQKTFFTDFKNTSDNVKDICIDIIVIGLLLDGTVSRTEKKYIKKLQQSEILFFDEATICKATNQFISGEKITILQKISE